MPLTMAMAGSVRLGCQTNAWRIQPGDFGQFLAVLDKVKGYRYDGFETGFRNVETRFAEPKAARIEVAAERRRQVPIRLAVFRRTDESRRGQIAARFRVVAQLRHENLAFNHQPPPLPPSQCRRLWCRHCDADHHSRLRARARRC